jgi:hypothetical protein
MSALGNAFVHYGYRHYGILKPWCEHDTDNKKAVMTTNKITVTCPACLSILHETSDVKKNKYRL